MTIDAASRMPLIECALWQAEARVSAQRSLVESMFEQRLDPRRAEAVLRELLQMVQRCQADRARALKQH